MVNCAKCGEEMAKLPFSSDPEEIRHDYFCGACNTRFGASKTGYFIVSESCNTSEIARENRELKITIKHMMKIKEDG